MESQSAKSPGSPAFVDEVDSIAEYCDRDQLTTGAQRASKSPSNSDPLFVDEIDDLVEFLDHAKPNSENS